MQNSYIALNNSLNVFTKTASIVIAGFSMTMLVGCNNSTDNTSEATTDAPVETVSTDANNEVIRIATEGAYPPFNYVDSSGELAGYDVDLVNALCEEMKAKCEIVAQDWDGIIPGLKAGKYDAVIAGMSITPKRLKQVDFSEPYFTNTLVFVSKEGETFDTKDTAVLNDLTFATQRSTVSSEWLEENLPEADAKLYDTITNAFLDLEAGRVDAILSDKAPAVEWLSKDKVGYTLVGEEIDINDTLGIAFRKDDALKQKFDTALASIKQNGTYDTVTDKYFTVASN